MNMTAHAKLRSQQRGIPLLIDQWLDQYGEEEYDGHGGVIRFFSKASRRAIEKDNGRMITAKLSEYINSIYKVSSHDGSTITLGHRTRRIKRCC